MKQAKILFLLINIWISSFALSKELSDAEKYFDVGGNRIKKFKYTYIDREHTFKEDIKNLAMVYGIAAVLYPATQPEVLDGKTGSWKKYKDNLGRLVFDQDEPFWNYFVHPFTGSQTFLYFRARGYSRAQAFKMSFITGALFEFTIETFSEPASIQDLINTPVLGSILGTGIESLSLYLINSGSTLGKVFGHLINPCTLLWFYEGRVRITPQYNFKNAGGVTMVMEF